jgi:hypothetical protein
MANTAGLRSKFDFISIGASLLCAVHCIALPIFFTTLPLLGIEIIENMWIETTTILISMLIGGWAIWQGYKKYHHRVSLPLIFLLGILLMVSGNFLHGETAEIATKLIAAVLLVGVHLKNWNLSVKKGHQHCNNH